MPKLSQRNTLWQCVAIKHITSRPTRPFYTPRRFALLCIKRPVNSSVRAIKNMTDEVKNWPPRTCDMPELPENYGKAFLSHLLNVFFANGGPSDFAAAAYSRNFIRLCDLAIQEYNLARKELIKYVSTSNNVMSPLFVATGHLEQCIHAIRRAIRFARHKNGPRLPRTEVISSSVEYRIRDLRDAIEHTDERVREQKIKQGEFLMLAVNSNSIALEGKEIFYSELAEWLKQLHQLSEFVATYRETKEQ